jgi:hypothetical protein
VFQLSAGGSVYDLGLGTPGRVTYAVVSSGVERLVVANDRPFQLSARAVSELYLDAPGRVTYSVIEDGGVVASGQ